MTPNNVPTGYDIEFDYAKSVLYFLWSGYQINKENRLKKYRLKLTRNKM